jgi:Domain of unknown function (DUF4333)
LRRARLFALVALSPAAASLAACGSSAPTLDVVRVERAIAATIRTQHQLVVTVVCPSTVPRKAGFVFTCRANLGAGAYPVPVTETNGSGHVRYDSQAPLVVLDVAPVERSIKRSILNQRRLRSTVTCPTDVLKWAGTSFICTATAGGRSYRFAVTEIDKYGRVRYVGLR